MGLYVVSEKQKFLNCTVDGYRIMKHLLILFAGDARILFLKLPSLTFREMSNIVSQDDAPQLSKLVYHTSINQGRSSFFTPVVIPLPGYIRRWKTFPLPQMCLECSHAPASPLSLITSSLKQASSSRVHGRKRVWDLIKSRAVRLDAA